MHALVQTAGANLVVWLWVAIVRGNGLLSAVLARSQSSGGLPVMCPHDLLMTLAHIAEGDMGGSSGAVSASIVFQCFKITIRVHVHTYTT